MGRWLPHTRGPRKALQVRAELIKVVGKLHLPSRLKEAAHRGFKPCVEETRCGQQGCTEQKPCLREGPWDQEEGDREVLMAMGTALQTGQGDGGLSKSPAQGQPFKQDYVCAILGAINDPEEAFFREVAVEGMHM